MAGTDTDKSSDPEKSSGPGWGFWLTLCSGVIVAVLVNQLEGPFARSIVMCDTPVDRTPGAPRPLSEKCGDRIFVIGEGARLSAQGQSLENFCKILMALITGNIVNIVGRKPLMILAVLSMWVSVILFVCACITESNPYWLFITAQGIQGMATGDMLANIVFADLSVAAGAKGGDILVKKEQVLGATGILSFWVAQVVAGFEMTNFLGIWSCMLCILSLAVVLCLLQFPETMKEKSDSSEEQMSFMQRLFAEFALYRTMFIEKPIVVWSLLTAFLSGLGQDAGNAMWAPFMMSYFGYTQSQLVVRILPFTVLAGATAPWVNNYCKKVGYTSGFWRMTFVIKLFGFTLMPLCVANWWMPWITKVCYQPLLGFGAVFLNIRNRLVGEKLTPKLESLQFLNYFAAQALGNHVHKTLFNEKAETVWQRFLSAGIFTSSLNLIDFVVSLFFLYPCLHEVIATMDVELAKERESEKANPADKTNADLKKEE